MNITLAEARKNALLNELEEVQEIIDRQKIESSEVYASLFENRSIYYFAGSSIFHCIGDFKTSKDRMNHTSKKEAERTLLYIQWKNIAEYVNRQYLKNSNIEWYWCCNERGEFNLLKAIYKTESIFFPSEKTAKEALYIFGKDKFMEMCGITTNEL